MKRLLFLLKSASLQTPVAAILKRNISRAAKKSVNQVWLFSFSLLLFCNTWTPTAAQTSASSIQLQAMPTDHHSLPDGGAITLLNSDAFLGEKMQWQIPKGDEFAILAQTAVCGDFIVDPSEGCDDGNTVNGDGCSSTCNVEAGYACPGGNTCFPVIYVKADAVGNNSGTSWANAYTDLQTAINASSSYFRWIWVAKGTYYPTTGTDRSATFSLKNNVSIYGGFTGTETMLSQRNVTANVTILSGDIDKNNTLDNGNAYHVVTGSGTDNTAVLDGFTITAGNATGGGGINSSNGGGMLNVNGSPTVVYCTFSGNSAGFGGGMYNINSSSPSLTNCTFSGNSARENGGGMYNVNNSSPSLTNCTFSGNSANSFGGGMYNFSNSSPSLTTCTFSGNSAFNGSGMFNSQNSSPIVTNCTFSGNGAFSGGGMFNSQNSSPTVSNCTFSGNSANLGGGMSNSNSSPILTNCSFLGNNAGGSGGGMYNYEGSSPTVSNCTFSGNSAIGGGGMSNSSSSPSVTNCTFSGNSVGDDGGGMYNLDSSPILSNCTFSGNSAGDKGGGMYNLTDSSPSLTNTLIWNNRDQSGTGTASASIFNNTYIDGGFNPIIRYSLIQSSGGSGVGWNTSLGTDGGNNKDVDPQFVTPVDPSTAPTTAGNLRLLPSSPAINMGNNAADLDGAGPGTTTIEDIATDLGGNPRIQLGQVDMGAYETQCSDYTFTNQIAYVDATPSGSGNNGSDWANAFKDVQSALTVACNCPDKIKDIWVAAGTYYPDEGTNQTDNDRNSTFQLCNNVKIYGGFNGTEAALADRNVTTNVTILSGDLTQNDGANFANNGENAYHVVTGSGTNATALLDGFTITAGNANGFSVINGVFGGGMYNNGGSPTVSNCTFSGNTANFLGGGMYNIGSSPSLSNCTFSGNTANFFGGGMCNASSSSPSLSNCTFSGNTAAIYGGGMYNSSSSPSLVNCTFSGNSALDGGGMYNASGSSRLANTIIWNNRANNSTGIAIASISNDLSTPTITYSLIQNITTDDANGNKDGITTAGNSNYPAFVTPVDPTTAPTTAGDLRLLPTSPAINMGNNAAVPADSKDVDNDGDTTEPTPDLDLNDRIVANTVDLGAFESPCATEAGEITNSLAANNLTICQGTDLGFTFSADNEVTDAAYLYAFLLADVNDNIIQFNTDGDFDLATLSAGAYTVYGLSYASFNTPATIAAYLNGKTISDIQTDDAGIALCLDLTGSPVNGQTNIINVNGVSGGSIAADQTICSGGDPAAFTSTTAGSGSGTITYRWESNTTGCDSTFTAIQGATGATYDPGVLTQTTYFRRVTISTLDGVACEAVSNCVTVTVNRVTAGSIAADQTICSSGDPTAFTSTTAGSGSGTITYRWESSTTNCESGFTIIQGATGATYDPGVLTQTTYFRRVTISTLNGVACEAISNCLTVTVNQITPGEIGGTQTVCITKDPAPFTSVTAATGSGTITYQWESSTTSCDAGFTPIDGATGATFDAAKGQFKVTTYFRRRAISTLNGVACDEVSNCITLTVLNVDCGQFPWNGN